MTTTLQNKSGLLSHTVAEPREEAFARYTAALKERSKKYHYPNVIAELEARNMSVSELAEIAEITTREAKSIFITGAKEATAAHIDRLSRWFSTLPSILADPELVRVDPADGIEPYRKVLDVKPKVEKLLKIVTDNHLPLKTWQEIDIRDICRALDRAEEQLTTYGEYNRLMPKFHELEEYCTEWKRSADLEDTKVFVMEKPEKALETFAAMFMDADALDRVYILTLAANLKSVKAKKSTYGGYIHAQE